MNFIGVSYFSNQLTHILFNGLFTLWIALEAGILISTMWRSFKREKNKAIKDRGSYFVIALGNWLSILISILLMGTGRWIMAASASYIGIMLLAFGIVFRFSAFWTLKKYFTVTVTTAKKQALIQNGPYKYVRHPAYFGSICIVLGIALSLRTALGFIISGLLMFAIYKYRINIEEKALKQRFGKEYVQYMRKTGGIFPKILK